MSSSPGFCGQRAGDLGVEAVDFAAAGKGDELDFARHSGLKANRRAGRDVQPEAKRLVTVELQRGVDLVKMEVAADLDRPIACVGDRQRSGLEIFVRRERPCLCHLYFAGDHRMGL